METFSGRPLSDRAMRSGSRADIHFRRLLWALAVVIGIELLVSQVISWEVSVWVAMCGDGLLALGTLGLFLVRIYRNREVDWLLLFVAVMMVLLAANHWEIAQSHPIAG